MPNHSTHLPLGPSDDEQSPASLVTIPEIRNLVERFYESARDDELLGPVFAQRVEDWDAHYAGTNVKIDTPNRPIFWYKRGNSDEYRVIYADLSIRDAVEAPDGSEFEVQPMKLAAPADSGN